MPGGGLGFLNKKYWHPARPQNLEIKWKKEQEAEAEKKRLDELRKQIEEERQREELQSVAEKAGIKKREERLDWMYQGGVQARQDADKRAEEALLTGKIPDAPVEQVQSRGDKVSLLPTFYAEDTPASANETWARLHNDPLFAIKQQEVAQRKQVLNNPMTMLQLKKQVSAVHGGDSKHKKKDKKEKKEKKEKKDKKDKHASRRQPSPVRGGEYRGGSGSGRGGGRAYEEHEEDGRGKRKYRDYSPDVRRNGDSKRYRSTTNGHHADQHHHNGRHDTRDTSHAAHHHHHNGHRDDGKDDARNGTHDGGGTNGRKYGLDYGAHNPDKAVGYDTSALAAATRQRLEAAAKRKAQEEREAAEERSQRRQHTTGRLSAEEKAARLAEMMRNAEEHEAHRNTRVVDATIAEQAEVAKEASRDANKFLRDAAGALGSGTSAADQIARRKHYSSKDGGRF